MDAIANMGPAMSEAVRVLLRTANEEADKSQSIYEKRAEELELELAALRSEAESIQETLSCLQGATPLGSGSARSEEEVLFKTFPYASEDDEWAYKLDAHAQLIYSFYREFTGLNIHRIEAAPRNTYKSIDYVASCTLCMVGWPEDAPPGKPLGKESVTIAWPFQLIFYVDVREGVATHRVKYRPGDLSAIGPQTKGTLSQYTAPSTLLLSSNFRTFFHGLQVALTSAMLLHPEENCLPPPSSPSPLSDLTPVPE